MLLLLMLCSMWLSSQILCCNTANAKKNKKTIKASWKPGVRQNIALQASPTARNLQNFCQLIQLHFSSNPLQSWCVSQQWIRLLLVMNCVFDLRFLSQLSGQVMRDDSTEIFSSRFCWRPLWEVVAWAEMSILWCCACSISRLTGH